MCYMRRITPILAILGALRGIANSTFLFFAPRITHARASARDIKIFTNKNMATGGILRMNSGVGFVFSPLCRVLSACLSVNTAMHPRGRQWPMHCYARTVRMQKDMPAERFPESMLPTAARGLEGRTEL